jgi:uncharacterized protein (DUF1800 family)
MITKEAPWAPYQPTVKDPWDLRKVAHLHRRAGFGATWIELQRDLKDGPVASINRLLKPRQRTTEEKEDLEALRSGLLEARDMDRLKAWWLYRCLWDPDPLGEKMTLFWHSHFATSQRKVRSIHLMLGQNDLLRKYALASFEAMLTGIITDPAMLIWLDGAGSVKAKPNENFAREFLELFTLGVDKYTEKDIREAARAFTGWLRTTNQFDYRTVPGFRFDRNQFDSGTKTFFKQTGAWKPADIVKITLSQPVCAEFLCRKLYRFLINEAKEPSAELIKPLAEEMRKSRYSIGHVVAIMLRSQHFFSAAAYRQRIKGPVEYSAGLLRTLEVPPEQVRLLALAVACDRQGQELFHPPNVKGWDGGRSWINSTTVLARGNWVSDVVWGNTNLDMKTFDPMAWANKHAIPEGKVCETLINLTLQGDLGEKARALILKTGADGKPDSLRKALQLALNCPEYQLA